MNNDSKVKKPQTQTHASWHKRLFAYMMSKNSGQYNDMVKDRKRTLLGSLHGNVLEIGAGTGPNLAFYAPDVQWLGIEPNPAMHSYLQKEADRLGIKIEIRSGKGELLDVPDETMDAVVTTLVLCSVHDPLKTLKEVLRVLKPGGQFVFIEHVAAARGTRLRRFQGFVRPLWRPFADGCYPDRETWTNIENAGFSQVKIEHFRIDSPIIGPHIAGFAVK